MAATIDTDDKSARVSLRSADGLVRKELTFFPDGSLQAKFSWDAAAFPAGSVFTTELSLSRPHEVGPDPGADAWQHPIETVAKSERGLDRTLQGTSVLLRWPIALGAATVDLPATGA